MTEISPSPAAPDPIPASIGRWTRPWFVLLMFVAIAFATYAPSLNGERIWDDHYLVGENPFFRSPVFAAVVGGE